jgi:ADP-ribose pyrophosphatase YjhB (NUDIX family)
MINSEEKPKVGVGVMIFKDGKVLLTKRKGSHGAGDYSFPGGHLEHMESFEECAIRETKEECGLEIKNIKFQYLTNVSRKKLKSGNGMTLRGYLMVPCFHFVTLHLILIKQAENITPQRMIYRCHILFTF